jgi:hypothetical protein
MTRRVLTVAALSLGTLMAGWAAGAADRGVQMPAAEAQATVVGTISAADHEIEEGYFSMGDEATLMAKPGSDLHHWLSTHRGQKVRLILTPSREGLPGNPLQRPGSRRDSGLVGGFPTGAEPR